MTSVTIGNGVTEIGNFAFAYCDALTSVTIGNGVTEISYCAFAYCDALTYIVIPDSVTFIGGSAFRSCSALTSVVIGNGVTEIGNSAFTYCSALNEIYCYATIPPSFENNTFDKIKGGATLYVPVGCESVYSSSLWNRFFENIVEMK